MEEQKTKKTFGAFIKENKTAIKRGVGIVVSVVVGLGVLKLLTDKRTSEQILEVVENVSTDGAAAMTEVTEFVKQAGQI